MAENVYYKTEFILKDQPLRMYYHNWGRIVIGYLRSFGQSPGTMLISGTIIDSDTEKDI
jgi:hypothetical protein